MNTYDSNHNGTLCLEEFQRVMKAIGIPMSRIDVYGLFKFTWGRNSQTGQTFDRDNSRIFIRDFVKQMRSNQSAQQLPLQQKPQLNDTANTTQEDQSFSAARVKERIRSRLNKENQDTRNNTVQKPSHQNSHSQSQKRKPSISYREGKLKPSVDMSYEQEELEKTPVNRTFENQNTASKSQERFEKCRNAIKIADLKRRIEQLVQKNQQNLQSSGLGHMGSSLMKASQMKIQLIREEYDKEKEELGKQLSLKNKEVEGFSMELENILREMEVINARHNLKKAQKMYQQ